MEGYQVYLNKAIEMIMGYGPKVIMAIVVLIVGRWVIRRIIDLVDKGMDRSHVDESLQKFVMSLLGVTLKILLLVSIATMIGIETTSFVAIIGAAGLAVGFALQGSLANFAGGVLILLFKPFKVGDVIQTQGYSGRVAEIQIFNTVLKTFDHQTIIIPNGKISGESLVNYSHEDKLCMVLTFGVGYGDDMKKTKAVLRQLVDSETRFHKDPAPRVLLSELGDSAVSFTIHAWCHTDDYWPAYYDMHENVKLTFDAEGISIPYPQQDVHLFQK